MVNVTDVAKAIGNTGQAKCKRKASSGYEPADDERDPKEYLASVDFPANLQMQGKSSPENPDDNSPSPEDEKSATESACEVGPHVVWRDFVLALMGLICQRYYESELSLLVGELNEVVQRTYFHAEDPNRETHAQVVA